MKNMNHVIQYCTDIKELNIMQTIFNNQCINDVCNITNYLIKYPTLTSLSISDCNHLYECINIFPLINLQLYTCDTSNNDIIEQISTISTLTSLTLNNTSLHISLQSLNKLY